MSTLRMMHAKCSLKDSDVAKDCTVLLGVRTIEFANDQGVPMANVTYMDGERDQIVVLGNIYESLPESDEVVRFVDPIGAGFEVDGGSSMEEKQPLPDKSTTECKILPVKFGKD